MCNTRLLNSRQELVISELMLEPSQSTPEDLPSISDLTESSDAVSVPEVTKELSEMDLKWLWDQGTSDLTDNQKLYSYWHKRLQHPTHETIKRLDMHRVILKRIATVTKPPLCAACVFAKAHKRSWRSKGDSVRHTDSNDAAPGDGTSCDHIISKQAGLIPQATGKLTHRRYYGATIFVDHFSRFVHASLSERATDNETLFGKHECERKMKRYGHTVRSYRADNSRFDSKDF